MNLAAYLVIAAPKTLQEAIPYFADYENCRQAMMKCRWPDGKVACLYCGSEKVTYLANARVWKCYADHAKPRFSLKTGTVFEDSPIALEKWLPVMWMLVNSKNGLSSWEIHRATGVIQKSAWFMLQRGRRALQDPTTGGKLCGEVEVDETFIGGKARNMQKEAKARKIQGRRGPEGKAIVAAVPKRGGKVRAKVVDKRKKKDLQALVRDNVEPKSALYSDALKSYEGLSEEYAHQVIDHAVAYVDGQVHTNGMETFGSVEPYHLFRYVDEQAFRFNNRIDMTDADGFDVAMSQIPGKRLTYSELIGTGLIPTPHNN